MRPSSRDLEIMLMFYSGNLEAKWSSGSRWMNPTLWPTLDMDMVALLQVMKQKDTFNQWTIFLCRSALSTKCLKFVEINSFPLKWYFFIKTLQYLWVSLDTKVSKLYIKRTFNGNKWMVIIIKSKMLQALGAGSILQLTTWSRPMLRPGTSTMTSTVKNRVV